MFYGLFFFKLKIYIYLKIQLYPGKNSGTKTAARAIQGVYTRSWTGSTWWCLGYESVNIRRQLLVLNGLVNAKRKTLVINR
jgi:hypothetical protein